MVDCRKVLSMRDCCNVFKENRLCLDKYSLVVGSLVSSVPLSQLALFFVGLLTLLFPVSGVASSPPCEISLKVIAADTRSGKAGPARIPAGLSDMSGALKQLSHLDFRFLSEHYAQSHLGKSSTLKIHDSMGHRQTVEVQPVEANSKMTDITVNWAEGSGEKLLATRVSLKNGKRMVLGTDSSGTRSTILGIKVTCP